MSGTGILITTLRPSEDAGAEWHDWVEVLDDICQWQLIDWLRESESTLYTPTRGEDALFGQYMQDLRKVVPGHTEVLCDLIGANESLGRCVLCQVEDGTQCILCRMR